MGHMREVDATRAGQARECAHGDDDAPLLSFVIPAFNEEVLIARTIGSIHRFVPPLSYEVIVVDNGSTDATATIAADLGANVIQKTDGTIGGLRNFGVGLARGAILIFLDADVVLTDEWAARIPDALASVRSEPRMMTGAWCSVPADASWLERWWFAPQIGKSHLGTGHMIMTRQFFKELGGFDESLATGEDYDLSRRALSLGGRIAIDERLKAEHLGFPRTVGAFVRREAWHGVGDVSSLSVFLRSKVSLATAAFVVSHAVLLGGSVAGHKVASAAGALGIVTVCLGSSYSRYRHQPADVIVHNTIIYWLYYFGRALAMVRRSARRAR
jgi:cellulose synthase/poly-beta-1,6-N-acetylglucosamine synthase-like glycosyltransferase